MPSKERWEWNVLTPLNNVKIHLHKLPPPCICTKDYTTLHSFEHCCLQRLFPNERQRQWHYNNTTEVCDGEVQPPETMHRYSNPIESPPAYVVKSPLTCARIAATLLPRTNDNRNNSATHTRSHIPKGNQSTTSAQPPPQEYPSPVSFSLSVYVSVSFVSTVLQVHNRSCPDETLSSSPLQSPKYITLNKTADKDHHPLRVRSVSVENVPLQKPPPPPPSELLLLLLLLHLLPYCYVLPLIVHCHYSYLSKSIPRVN